MKRNLLVLGFVGAFVGVLLSVTAADARMGGGRSFGSRGSRGFSPSYRSTAPSYGNSAGGNPYGRVQPSAPVSPGGFGQPAPSFGGGGGFMRGMMGGIAGGFLGSMLFRGLGYGGGMGMPAGGGGIGLLEILLLCGGFFLLLRWVLGRRMAAAGPSLSAVERPNASPDYGQAPQHSTESVVADSLRRYDGAFDLRRFKDERINEFFQFQTAWSQRDLGRVRHLFAPEIAQALDGEVARLKSDRRINRLENISVRETEVVEAWQELGKDYVTMRIHANLVDYTMDEASSSILEGDKNSPVNFEEYWTYTREVGSNAPGSWRLSAISNN